MQQQYTRINNEWHQHNRMPKNPTLKERLQWHLAHEKNCSCRPIPEKLKKELRTRRTKNSEQGTKT